MLNNLRCVYRNSGRQLSKSITRSLYNFGSTKSFSHVKNLAQVMYTAEMEEEQRKGKFLEYTKKVYKPSKTITFDRNGEILLFSADNFKHSQVYLKYPYCMIDSLIPLAVYSFFCNPLNLSWQVNHTLFHTAWMLGWMPHFLYIRSLSTKIRKIYLMRGGKYVRIEMVDWMGDIQQSWNTIADFHVLTEDSKRFADEENFEFLNKEGQLKFELGLQIDYFQYYGYIENNGVIQFMKEGVVHEPELFEQVVRGYNIDTTDFEINTEDNIRWMEPSSNY